MRGRKLQVEWNESEAALREQYQREREPRQRQYLHALWLLRAGHRQADVAAWLGVSRRSVQRWVQWYRAGGVAGLRTHLPRTGGGGARGKLSPAQEDRLREAARQGQFGTVWEARDWIQEQWGISYSYWGCRLLLRRLQLRKKVPRPLAAKGDPAVQEQWKKGACKPR